MTEEQIEQKRQTIILNSFDEKLTKRRMKQVIFFGCLFLALILGAGLYLKNLALLTSAAVVYIVITIYEKIAYGYGVIVYKRIIRMLLTDQDSLEKYREFVRHSEVKAQ
jgi:hypothetical protein